VTAGAAEAVRRFRDERGMSAQDVADATAELGYPIQRSVIANLENGRRVSVDLAEFLVLAKALDVPPVALLVPAGEVGEMEILPGQICSTDDALQWITGETMLDDELDEDTVELLFDDLRRHRQGVQNLLRSISRAEEYRRGAVLTRDQATREASLQLVARFDELVSKQSRSLQDFRASMRARGIQPPTLPPTLSHIDYVESGDSWVHYSEAPDAPGSRPPTDEERAESRAALDRPSGGSRRKDRS
jgi:transcriptional regulator with XRE-family HTH domain